MMKIKTEQLDLIDAYLRGDLPEEQRLQFEQLRLDDPAFDLAVIEHENLLRHLAEHHQRATLLSEMNRIHSQLDVDTLSKQVRPDYLAIRYLWNKYRATIAIAATVALVAVFGTLFSTGYFVESAKNLNLRREINSIKKSQISMIRSFNGKVRKGPENPGQFGGTGFALTSNGFIVTNFHVVRDADSIYVQNSVGEAFKARQVYADASYDLAILEIIDPAFEKLSSLPYTFKKSPAKVGEEVYTIGFPKDDLVYNEGYLSSKNGYAGDTLAYQVAIPVNPGNSGGPVLDDKGNVIGIINRKQNLADGVAFAVKSGYLLKSLDSIEPDSIRNKITVNKRNSLAGLRRPEQFEKMQPYIFMVQVY